MNHFSRSLVLLNAARGRRKNTHRARQDRNSGQRLCGPGHWLSATGSVDDLLDLRRWFLEEFPVAWGGGHLARIDGFSGRPPSFEPGIGEIGPNRDVYLSVTLAWVLAALLGGIPFFLEGTFSTYSTPPSKR